MIKIMINIVPLIYVCYGEILSYLHIVAEMGSRNNHVVVLSVLNYKQNNPNITYDLISNYVKSAKEFVPLYRHMVRVFSAYFKIC